MRTIKDGPRVLDLDLLLYEGMKSESFLLTLPHPRIHERAFVMVPLLDLFPSGRAPGLFFLPALHEIGTDGVERINEEITLPEDVYKRQVLCSPQESRRDSSMSSDF